MILLAAIGGCADPPGIAERPSLAGSLQAIADEAGLSITDVSVPFERLSQAPAQLKAVSRFLDEGPPGVYVMRYSDDTLRETFHVFVIGASKRVYVRLSSTPYEDVIRERRDILASRYEEAVTSLLLETPAGVLELAPQDVTPVGA